MKKKKLKLPRMVEVKQDTQDPWLERSLLAVLPDYISYRYICDDGGLNCAYNGWRFMREIPTSKTVPYDINDYYVGMVLVAKRTGRERMVVQVDRRKCNILIGEMKMPNSLTTTHTHYDQLHPDGTTTPLTKEVTA